MKRAIIIVMDSVGIGELPDADKYGDTGSNTLGNIVENYKDFKLPNLQKLGLSNIEGVNSFPKTDEPIGCFGRMQEKSPGKDTTTGHWEIGGIVLENPFPVYPEGFPVEIIESFEKEIGTKILGNVAASGTEIIKELGEEHMRTGHPIVYTSADSVFQIAAHEDIISIDKLYDMCSIARKILTGKHAVGRVIARPFIGKPGSFVRTQRRKDFSLMPIEKTILDIASQKGYFVKTVGKINDIFLGQGITHSVKASNNSECMDRTIEYINESFEGIIFTNFVDFDMLYGHRNDVDGYAKALMEFDSKLPKLLSSLKEGDILFITADHGCDPTTDSTDHSREYVPLLVYGKGIQKGVNLGTRECFCDIAATIASYLKTDMPPNGASFFNLISGEVI